MTYSSAQQSETQRGDVRFTRAPSAIERDLGFAILVRRSGDDEAWVLDGLSATLWREAVRDRALDDMMLLGGALFGASEHVVRQTVDELVSSGLLTTR